MQKNVKSQNRDLEHQKKSFLFFYRFGRCFNIFGFKFFLICFEIKAEALKKFEESKSPKHKVDKTEHM